MDFSTAVATCLAKYFKGHGRASRAEFWWFWLFCCISIVLAAILAGALEMFLLVVIVGLFLLPPLLAVSARRLHDHDRSDAWLLLYFLPGGGLMLWVFFALPGTVGPNSYGVDRINPGHGYVTHRLFFHRGGLAAPFKLFKVLPPSSWGRSHPAGEPEPCPIMNSSWWMIPRHGCAGSP
jgi:uncharacterized membrane protein YhaH (DUF805 family)